MNKLQIQNIDPNSEHCGKTYSEENLQELLADEGEVSGVRPGCFLGLDLDLRYSGGSWRIEYGYYTDGYDFPFRLWIDKPRFQVSFQNTMPVSEVRKMVQEMRQSAYCRPNSVVIKDEILDALDGIANKYLPQE